MYETLTFFTAIYIPVAFTQHSKLWCIKSHTGNQVATTIVDQNHRLFPNYWMGNNVLRFLSITNNNQF